MILNIIVILGTLGLGFAWSSKARGYGFFSAMITLACVIVAGAIAFGLWETVTEKAFFSMAGGDGFFARLAMDNAWGLGLLVPYVAALLVLRLLADKFVDSNLDMSDTVNLVGGGLTGIVAGALTMGIVVIGLGNMRFGPAVFGYQPMSMDNRGNVTLESPLWVPVDLAVVKLYEGMSVGSFATGTPLAEYRNDAHIRASLLRMTYEGSTRPTLLPGDIDVVGRYVLNGRKSDLLSDSFQPTKAHQPILLDGSEPEEGSALQGYVLKFGAGAKEKSGNVIVTSSQVQLVVEASSGGLETVLPIALVERTAGGSLAIARFRFDAEGTAATSVGGAAESVFAFEFLVPPGATARHMFVKGIRVDLEGLNETTLAGVSQRDDLIRNGEIFTPFGISAAGSATASIDDSASQQIPAGEQGRIEEVSVGNRFPYGVRLQSSVVRGRMTLGDDNQLASGDSRFDSSGLAARDLDKSLVVDTFATPKGTSIVQIVIADSGQKSIFGREIDSAGRSEQPFLRDTNGLSYPAIGYVLSEGDEVAIKFDPQSPINSVEQIPSLSSTRQQSLTLIFAPDAGVTLTGFVLGSEEKLNFGDGIRLR